MAMEAQGYQVEYEGRMYSSLREFAEELNLNYPKVTAYFRKGKSLEAVSYTHLTLPTILRV